VEEDRDEKTMEGKEEKGNTKEGQKDETTGRQGRWGT